MADLSWISALTNQGGGGGSSGGVSDYDQLKNRPVTNIAGTGTVISALETGVYNIEGTWKLTPDDIERETLADDLFYVMNNGAESKLTWISAGQIKTYSVPVGGTAADITEGSIATTEEVVRNMVGVFLFRASRKSCKENQFHANGQQSGCRDVFFTNISIHNT